MENTRVGAYSREDFVKNGEIQYSKLKKEFGIPEEEAKEISDLNKAIISGNIKDVIRNATIPDENGIHNIKGAMLRLAAAFCKGEAFEAVYKAMDKNYADLKKKGETNIIHAFINDADENGYTPLLIAAKAGNLENLKFLLSEPGADITMKTKDGLTIHELACLSGNLEMVKYVFEKYPYSKAKEIKIKPSQIAFKVRTPDEPSTKNDSARIIRNKKIKQKPIEQEPVKQEPVKQEPADHALEYAIKSNSPEVVNYLLKNGCKVENDDLSYAVLRGNVEIAELIYSKMPQPNSNDKESWLSTDCFEKAIKSKNKEMVSFLIKNNFCSINKPRQFYTGENDTPLQFAIKTKNIEMIEYLINEKNAPIYPINPSDSSIKDNYDNNVNYLEEAIRTGDKEIFNLIKEAYSKKLQEKVDENYPKKEQKTKNPRIKNTIQQQKNPRIKNMIQQQKNPEIKNPIQQQKNPEIKDPIQQQKENEKKKYFRKILKLKNNSCLLNAIESKNPEILKSVIGELKYSDLLKGLGNSGEKNAIDLLYSDEYKSLRAKICKNSDIKYKIEKAKLKQEIEEMKEVESISKKTIKVLNFDFKRDNLSFLSINLERLKKQLEEKRKDLEKLKDIFKKMKECQSKFLDTFLKYDGKKEKIEESTTTQTKFTRPGEKSEIKTVKKSEKVRGSTKLEPMEEKKTDIEQDLLDAGKELIERIEREGGTYNKQKGTFTF